MIYLNKFYKEKNISFKGNKLYDIYTKECRGKMTKKQIIEELKHDKWWNSDKCIKKGLCDELLKSVLV